MGDQLDRGDDELQVLYFLERVAREAQVRRLSRSLACTCNSRSDAARRCVEAVGHLKAYRMRAEAADPLFAAEHADAREP